jgi:hypothetical protein
MQSGQLPTVYQMWAYDPLRVETARRTLFAAIVAGAVGSLLAAQLATDDKKVVWGVTRKLARARGSHRCWQAAKYTGHFLAGYCVEFLTHKNRFDVGIHSRPPKEL